MSNKKDSRHTPVASLLDMLAGFADRASIASERVKDNLCPNCGEEPRMSESIPICTNCGRNVGIAGVDMLLAALKKTK